MTFFFFFLKVDLLSLYIINLSITLYVREKDHKNIEENSQDQIRSSLRMSAFFASLWATSLTFRQI